MGFKEFIKREIAKAGYRAAREIIWSPEMQEGLDCVYYEEREAGTKKQMEIFLRKEAEKEQ